MDPVTGVMTMPAFARAYVEDVLHGNLDEPAMWYIDMRHFRSINPKYGFMVGSSVLQIVAQCIKSSISHDLPIVRLGADRFVFVSCGLDFEAAQQRFEELVDCVNAKAKSQGVNTRLVLTGGIYYLGPVDYQSGSHNRALDYASIAHRKARREKGSALLMFTQEDLERDNRRITIEQSIDKALAEGQIEVWFQPQIDYIYSEVIGAEALARWNHPELGWIESTEFVPVLENCGKVHELDLFVWEEACRNAGRWRSASDGSPVPISVNVSRTEMFEEGLIDYFLGLQQKYDLPDGSLHVEITESAFVEEADRLYDVIMNMRKHNIFVEMDDFGNGLSSLTMLKDVPVDAVKLDMGFMKSSVGEERGGVVLSSVIRMLQALDTPIIAEGVETREQAEMLKNMGCRLMQGYHFSRPMRVGEFEDYLASNSTVESNERRMRGHSRIDELTSIDAGSSYLFNNVIGATLFFFAAEGASESILVNDEFYEVCGLDRDAFGNAKVNPIEEIEPEFRETFWRAASEARENGAALCGGKVMLSGRWIDCVMRYLGTNARGDVFSLNVFRWGELDGDEANTAEQRNRDNAWVCSMLDRIVSCAFAKCKADDQLTFEYVSPKFIANSGLERDEFSRRYHNSLAQYIVAADRDGVVRAVQDAVDTGDLIDCSFNVKHGFWEEQRVQMLGRIEHADEETWVYLLMLVKDGMANDASAADEKHLEPVIPFEFDLNKDKLVIHDSKSDGIENETVVEGFLEHLATLPSSISKGSASRILASIHDLKYHPSSGFTDLKCNLRGGKGLRWYHINFMCDTDEDGTTAVVRGFAQDANDQMGSAKWWRRQAEIDQLTGLLNRNAVEQEVNLSMRTHGAGMMFMIDLDGFKRVNDEMGHLAGDALLRDVAEALSERFRESDVLGRYGGDEFVAFVSMSTGDAHEIAERRAKAIIDAVSSRKAADGRHAACSVGVAVSDNKEATFYDLLEVADQALYMSKLGGKGTYTVLDMKQASS